MLLRLSRQWLAIGLLAALLTACGGGGGGGGSGSSSHNTNSPTPTPSRSPTPAPSTSRNLHISWSIPTTRADGSALSVGAISGYRLFYFRDGSSSSEDVIVPINGGTTTSINLSLASAGTYTFAITAIDIDGAESSLSTPVSVIVN